MSDPAIFYVYILFDENAIPRYVGKGCGTRIQSTLVPSRHNHMKNAFLKRTVEEMGYVPFVFIREGVTEIEALEIESAFIAAIGRRKTGHGPLTNISPGGDGMTSESARELAASYSPEKRLQVSKAISDAHRRHSPEARRERALSRQQNLGAARRKIAGQKGAVTRMSQTTPEERSTAALKASLTVTAVFWINDGKNDRRINSDDKIPAGWKRGRFNINSDIIKTVAMGTRWINDGTSTKRLKPHEELPNGWVYGRKAKIAASTISHPAANGSESPITMSLPCLPSSTMAR